jgi:transposase
MARSQELARLFQRPDSPAQRHYEICRAYFHESASADDIAQRFHLHVGSVRAIVHNFARDPDVNAFFTAAARPGPKTSPKRDAISQHACELRRQGATLADILATLKGEGFDVSESYLFRLLSREGLAATRQRRPTPQPGDYANDGSVVPDIADVRQLVFEEGRRFDTKVAGLFLFLPSLLDLDLPQSVAHAGLPGSEQIPPLQALLALLVPKLVGKRRVSHISDLCDDPGAGLFAGLNVLPKITYATDYSYKTERPMSERLITAVIAKTRLGDPPLSFNLDFHAIPFRGAEPDLENHWVPMRNRGLPSVMAFVAQAAGRRICYATANLLRDESDRMVPRFADYWKEQTGHSPARLLFDARATTYAGLSRLTQRQVGFITIRRRGSGMLARVGRLPADRWQHCQITQSKGKRRKVQYVDEWVQLDGYEGLVRQLIVTGLGHKHPTFFLTNDLPQPQTAREAIQTYASRNHVENNIGEHITFFHLDCLCSDVRLNVDFDLTLTVLADLLYRNLAERLKGFARVGPSKSFRKFVDTPGMIEITEKGVIVYLSKRAHNPLLKEAELTKPTGPVPWLAGRSVRIVCP